MNILKGCADNCLTMGSKKIRKLPLCKSFKLLCHGFEGKFVTHVRVFSKISVKRDTLLVVFT